MRQFELKKVTTTDYKNIKLNPPQYIGLYCDLAHAMLEESAIDQYWVTDDDGNENYTDEAQEMFNHFVGIVEYILENNGIENGGIE
jgi:hypothetical protein